MINETELFISGCFDRSRADCYVRARQVRIHPAGKSRGSLDPPTQTDVWSLCPLADFDRTFYIPCSLFRDFLAGKFATLTEIPPKALQRYIYSRLLIP